MGMFFTSKKSRMPRPEEALPGRTTPIRVGDTHFVNGHSITKVPDGMQRAMFGMGCFWGAERKFWQVPGVWSTAVGYASGLTPNPTYEEVCSGGTGHNEVVLVIFDPKEVSYEKLLALFWESHDPTQGMAQGNDVGTQYRSGVYTFGADQQQAAEASKAVYQQRLTAAGHDPITSEIVTAPAFYYAEENHQQYLGKNPGGYCGLGGTGVSCPIGSGVGVT